MSVLLTLGLILSLIFCGLTIDVGLLELEKTQMQTAADAAAIAGEMYFERTPYVNGTVGNEAANAAAQYGFVNGSNQTTVNAVVSLAAAAVGGDYNGHHDTVQVTITRQVPTVFLGLVNIGTIPVSATATASPPPCQYFLGTQALAAYTVTLRNTAATAQWYSKCSAYIGGGMSEQAGSWWQAFQTYFTGPSSASVLLGRTKQGTTFNSNPINDPLAGIALPSPSSCLATNYSQGNFSSRTSFTLTPGMTLLNANVTFNPGLYVVRGGVQWQAINATGSGVTFFFTNVAGTGKYGSVSLSRYNTLNLTAASGVAFGTAGSDGAIAGILLIADRNWINTSPQDVSISLSNGSFAYNGVWYLPSTGLSLQDGSSSCVGYCGIVADNLFVGNFTQNLYGTDYTLYPGSNPLRTKSVLVQ